MFFLLLPAVPRYNSEKDFRDRSKFWVPVLFWNTAHSWWSFFHWISRRLWRKLLQWSQWYICNSRRDCLCYALKRDPLKQMLQLHRAVRCSFFIVCVIYTCKNGRYYYRKFENKHSSDTYELCFYLSAAFLPYFFALFFYSWHFSCNSHYCFMPKVCDP